MEKKNILVGKKGLESPAGKTSTFSSVTTNKYSTKAGQIGVTYPMGGISGSTRSSLGAAAGGDKLTLFWQLCNPGKYGILTGSLSSSRPNAVAYSN